MSNPSANNVPAVNYWSNGGNVQLALNGENYLPNDPFLNIISPNKFLPFPGKQSSVIQLGPRTVTFAANTLGSTKHIYTSPYLTDIQALAAYFADFGFSYTITEGPYYTIAVDVAWDSITDQDYTISEYADETWEILPVAGSKSLVYSGLLPNPFQPPIAAGNYMVLPLVLQSAIQRAVKSGGNYLNITGSLSSAQQAQYADFIPVANQVLQYLKLGVDGIQQFTQQLKRSAVIDVNNTQGAFQLEIDDFRTQLNAQGTVNFILSAKDMDQFYPLPPAVLNFLMPSYSKQLGVPNLDPIIYNVYAGYLVSPPTVSFIGLNKVQLTQIFTWDEWAAGLYYMQSEATDFPLVYSAATT